MHTIILSGNCFWALQAVFEQVRGVSEIECGYIWMEAGAPPKPSTIPWPVQQMEVIRCQWDPATLSAQDLTRMLLHSTSAGLARWDAIDELSGMRSLIAQIPMVFHKDCWETISEVSVEQGTPLHTQIVSSTLDFKHGSPADQQFFKDNPQNNYSCGIIAPKLQRLRIQFPHLVKS